MSLGTFNPKPANHKTGGPAGNNPESIALQQKIIALVTKASNTSERNLQTAIGPSEIGHPCPRKIAYKLAGVRENNRFQDPLPSVLGVAFHAWMEVNLPRDEWIPEQRVNVDGVELYGHSDAYHRPTGTVVDWKMLGRTMHQQWLGGYTNDTYRVQAHSYGQGFHNMGLPVNRVAVAVFCRAKTLQDLYVWSEPWDPEVARRAIERLGIIRTYVETSGASDSHRQPLTMVPAVAGDGCYFCLHGGKTTDGKCDKRLAK